MARRTRPPLSKPGKRKVAGKRPSAADFERIISSIGEITYEIAVEDDPMVSTVRFVSPNVAVLLGRPAEEFLADATLWFRLLHPDDAPAVAETTRELCERGEPRTRQYRLRHATGEYRWMEDRVMTRANAAGRVTGFIGAARDVTDRILAEDRLRQSEERYRTLFETSADAVVVSSAEGRLLDVNRAAEELFGMSREELLHVETRELYAHPDDRARFQREIAREGRVTNVEVQFRRRDGATRDCLLSVTTRHDADGAVIEYQGVAHDITGRKRAEELVRASRDRLRALAAELRRVREHERTAIAREVHDELGQQLTGLKMDLTRLLDRVVADPDAVVAIEGMLELTDRCVESVRGLATRLRPAVLDEIGVVAALEWLAADFAKHSGIPCACDVPDAEPALDQESATAVFRIAQEALTNVGRHAGATSAALRFVVEPGGVRLEISDSGAGISERQMLDAHALGLIGMRERAGALGGRVYVHPGSDGGTQVVLELPHQPPDGGAGAP